MEITSTQVFTILIISLIPAILAYKLGNELAK